MHNVRTSNAASKAIRLLLAVILFLTMVPVSALLCVGEAFAEDPYDPSDVAETSDSLEASEEAPALDESEPAVEEELADEESGEDPERVNAVEIVDQSLAEEAINIDPYRENSWRYKNGQRIRANTDGNTGDEFGAMDGGLHTWSNAGNGTWYTYHGGAKSTVSGAKSFGVDVSKWQGWIDWQRAKDGGVQFAIIRVAHGTSTFDQYFDRNVKECKRLGIPFGIYIYSTASSTSQALAEAEFTLSKMQASGLSVSDVSYPVFYDLEESALANAKYNSLLASMATVFCNRIQAAGYMPGVYANRNWWNNYLTDGCFNNWVRWVAAYFADGAANPSSGYGGRQDMWQCMSDGNVQGISGNVDIDFDYTGFCDLAYRAIYDYDYYTSHNPDVAKAFNGNRMQTLNHFLNYGIYEGRSGNGKFNIVCYYNANADLRRAFGANVVNLYMHYLNYGYREGRACSNVWSIQNYATSYAGQDYSKVYDGSVYYGYYSDLRTAFNRRVGALNFYDDAALIQHFVNHGMSEGRVASKAFNPETYYNRYQDLRRAFGANLKSYYTHFVSYGYKEGRSGSGSASLTGWLTTTGGVNYSRVYDGAQYYKYTDLAKAFTKRIGSYSLIDDSALLNHFVRHGMPEGRIASSKFKVATYKSRYSDLQRAFGNNLKSYYIHYISYGYAEGRSAS